MLTINKQIKISLQIRTKTSGRNTTKNKYIKSGDNQGTHSSQFTLRSTPHNTTKSQNQECPKSKTSKRIIDKTRKKNHI